MNGSRRCVPGEKLRRVSRRQDEESRKVVEALSQPAAYPESTTEVHPLETHISWVFLTDQYAYKLKKPLKLDFLNYGTIEARRRMCHEEVRLNRRLARDVYLGVQPVTSDEHGSIKIDASGDAVDWVVEMRRLSADTCLENTLHCGDLTETMMDNLLKVLAAFYRSLPPEQIGVVEYRKRLIRLVIQNRKELIDSDFDFPSATIKRLHSSQLQMLELEADAFSQRVRDGRIVEGHGDLRPEHVYFVPMPRIIDCIEFNRQIRQLDVLDELCFFEMECDRLGASSVGRRISDGIGLELRDNQPARICDFYKCYRACVRAKVSVMRAAQFESNALRDSQLLDAWDHARQYLELAQEYESTFANKKLIIVRGLMGTGKTTVATGIGRRLGAEHLMTDRIRRELFKGANDRSQYGHGRYSEDNRLRVYSEMFRRAAELLQSGLTVVLDGTFLSAGLRMSAHSLARRYGATCEILRCHCPQEVAMARIARRAENEVLSEARPDLFSQQCHDEDAMLESGNETDLPTLGSADDAVAAAIEHLKAANAR